MEVILDIARSLLIIIIVASFLELLLPDGSFRPWVRFIAGMFVLVAILAPVLGSLNSRQQFSLEAWDYRVEAALQEQVAEQGTELQNQIGSSGRSGLEQKVQGQIQALAMMIPGVYEVQSVVELSREGEIQSLHLIIESRPRDEIQEIAIFNSDLDQQLKQAEITERLSVIVANFYGLRPDQISFEFI